MKTNTNNKNIAFTLSSRMAFVIVLLCCVFSFVLGAMAQNPDEQAEMQIPLPVSSERNINKDDVVRDVKNKYAYENFPSLLFTFNEQENINLAIKATGLKRLPTDQELQNNRNGTVSTDDVAVAPPPENRFVELSGLAFEGKKNWTMWLNNKRVTPTTLSPEIVDLKVMINTFGCVWLMNFKTQVNPIA